MLLADTGEWGLLQCRHWLATYTFVLGLLGFRCGIELKRPASACMEVLWVENYINHLHYAPELGGGGLKEEKEAGGRSVQVFSMSNCRDNTEFLSYSGS